ncbi:MAG: hypothetical protein PHZ19_02080 [Candidatus Thermoplasmatota archaeon]|nr:hypothetical protein [Candidatus Thermoplasmatota archaeon]
MSEKSIVGDLINFRGLVYAPLNENGVVFLFGKVMDDLGMYIEEIKPGFPDCVARRFTGKGWERVSIEFEYKSSNFKDHRHDPDKCDIIICWEHDWDNCPLEVIELRDIIKDLPNPSIKRPSKEEEQYQLADLYKKRKVSDKIRMFYEELDNEIKKIDEEIYSNIAKTCVSYYSPERVFTYVYFLQTSIRFELFTRGDKIQSVKNFDPNKAGAKWGCIYFKKESDKEKVIDAIKTSYGLIKKAIKNNERTGWYAPLEEREQETTE